MHCITLYLINKSELRSDKIDFLLTDKESKEDWIELESNILASTNISKEFRIDKTIAKISTDYFGGSGNQSAKLFVNNKKVYDKSDEHYGSDKYASSPINEVLKMIGVVKINGMDEFDTIGLGKYRSNNDLIK